MMFKRLESCVGNVFLAVGLLLLPSATHAQTTNAISGIVTDTSAGVLPGVTVEVASPALIEKVRNAVTDSQGLYNIIDLRPGTYSVTFGLPGFNTVRREGIVLTAGFTATVDGEMRVGEISETITVTGESPLVDVQNSRQQVVFSSELLEVLPTGHNQVSSFVALTPGLVGSIDVGGTAGERSNQGGANIGFHGKTSRGKILFDGMNIANMMQRGQTSYLMPMHLVQETTVETGGANAESNVSGVAVNAIPRDGGNTFHGAFTGMWSNGNLVSSNSEPGQSNILPSGTLLTRIYHVTSGIGGPIVRDKVWFYGGTSHSANNNLGVFHNRLTNSPLYEPDTSRPSKQFEFYRSYATRVTWQASQKHKFAFFQDTQHSCQCRQEGNRAPEAQKYTWFWPQGLYQASWSAPITNKLLVDGGYAAVISHYDITLDKLAYGPSITESSTGLIYNSFDQYNPLVTSDRYPARFALTYVTGTHAFKTGLQIEQGDVMRQNAYTNDQSWTFNQGRPSSITQFASPWETTDRLNAELGVFAQDQWQFSRATLNLGVRFEYFNSSSPAQELPARQFIPAQSFAAVPDVPEWFDLSPRLGAAFDLFGNGRTAVKMSFGKYMDLVTSDIANANNPIISSVTSANRTWNDLNGNFIPDCDLKNFAANGASIPGSTAVECGPILNSNFGKNNPNASRWSDDVLRGWGKRIYTWDSAFEMQHQLTDGFSVSGGYYRNWDGNLTVVDNLLIGPQDFNTYCIAAPLDDRLPKGGGYPICGLYDIKPAAASLSQTEVGRAKHFGKSGRTANFYNVNVNSRLGNGVRFGGGVDWGTNVVSDCLTVDSPQQELLTIDGVPYCRQVSGWKQNIQAKFFGSYPLPGGFNISGTFLNNPGPALSASYAAPNAIIAPSLGRNLGACGTAPGACNRTATVPLVPVGTLLSARRTQFDMRFSKVLRSGGSRMSLNLDAYNLFNANAPEAITNNFGPAWQRVTRVMAGRLLQISGNYTFGN